MRIVNPSFGHQPVSTEKVKAGTVDWLRDPIILFSNSKPNAQELLQGVEDRDPELCEIIGGIAAHQHVESGVEGAAWQVPERRSAPDRCIPVLDI